MAFERLEFTASHYRPAESAKDAIAEIGVKINTVASIDLKILSRC